MLLIFSCRKAGTQLAAEFDAAYISQVSRKTVRLYSGIKSLVRDLHHKLDPWSVGALTNGATGYANTLLEVHGIGHLFACVHGVEDVPNPKPEPDGLLQCCSELVTRV